MSETQVIAPLQINEEKKMDECESQINANSATEADVDEADLEDGEIDDDDENDDDGDSHATSAAIAIKFNENSGNSTHTQQNVTPDEKAKHSSDCVTTIDLDDSGQGASPTQQSTKSKKRKPLEDDHASTIEHALANALKKKGIEPVVTVIDPRNGQDDQQSEKHSSSSRSSRRRKRKKQRDEKEKQKGHSETKKSRYDSPEPAKQKSLDMNDDDEMMDDYEMLNVRGGSPPPMPHLPPPINPTYKDQYDSGDESNYSYDSCDSPNDGDSPSESRRRRRKKDKESSRKRRDRSGRGSNRDDDRRQEKRHRRDSPDRQEPRKLELCKFYLMECCAKRDKCSYMHGDFPCKYYYLGMECAQREDCKFSHGEPLSEQLRNILLKHLETAPKEILGNFKRISREQAVSQMTQRHDELCKKFGVDNTWSKISNLVSNHNRRGGNSGANNDHQQQQHQFNNQLQQSQLQQHNSVTSNIPSLLDIKVMKPQIGDLMNLGGNNNNSNSSGNKNSPLNEKQRKSRWNENSSNDSGVFNNRTKLETAASTGPSYLDLKNLFGILSEEHINQLSQIGITNLEQVNQLTVGQLNQIGLTIGEISEIQLNAKNMAKLGTMQPVKSLTTASNNESNKNSPKTELSGDASNVDLKPIATKSKEPEREREDIVCSNSNSNSGVVVVDYSQYLKDSNLPYDRGDDDERDDEQLVIDDDNLDSEENPFGSPLKSGSSDTKKRKDSLSDSEQPQFGHKLQTPDFGSSFCNPFSALPSLVPKQQNDPRLSRGVDEQHSLPNKKSTTSDGDSDDERYYASRGRRSRSVTPTRSGSSSTPEGSQSPQLEQFGAVPKPHTNPKYERSTMYDFNINRAAEEDEAYAAKTMKADKDMRFPEGTNVGSGDIDLRLPFLPVTNYTPATEIDGSITSHLPMTYKVYEVDVKIPSYAELRQNFKSDQTSDPRLRRILGLAETSQTRTAVALSRSVRKLSNTIASPESSDGASPRYYTPSMSSTTSSTAGGEERSSSSSRRNRHISSSEHASTSPTTTATANAVPPAASQPRGDPRRAARQAAEAAKAAANAPNNFPGSSTASTGAPNNATKQNVEIRNYLQKSEWYKNLNSKFKIMVNQQLALVSTELKKFHQDPSPTKIFDIAFIVNNSTLQQILTNLGIFIDDNGEVSHIDGDVDDSELGGKDMNNSNNPNQSTGGNNPNIVLPNLSQPPPLQQQQQQQLEFLRNPPPSMFRQGMNIQQFSGPPPNTRPSLLGMPPGAAGGIPRNPFNPFGGNMQVPFVNGPMMGPGPGTPSLLGPGPGGVSGPGPMGFGNFGMPANMQQRNFGNGGNNQQRNQRQRRSK